MQETAQPIISGTEGVPEGSMAWQGRGGGGRLSPAPLWLLPAPCRAPLSLPVGDPPVCQRRGVSGGGGAAEAPSRGPVPISMPTGDVGGIAMGWGGGGRGRVPGGL